MSPRRKPFILIEVIIASLIFSILLAVMFGIFVRYAQTNQFLTKQRVQCERMLVVQSKLQAIFDQYDAVMNKHHYFYIEEPRSGNNPSLVFSFDNGIDVNPQFSCDVLGKLYVADDNLYLAYWATRKNKDKIPTIMRQELLLKDIASLQIELFARPQSREKKTVKEEKKKEEQKIVEGRWLTKWPMEFQRYPALVKLTCTRLSGEAIPFYFFLPGETLPILYTKVM